MKKIKRNHISIFLLINVLLSVYSDFVLDGDIRARIPQRDSFQSTRRPDNAYEQNIWQKGSLDLAVVPFSISSNEVRSNLADYIFRNNTSSNETVYQVG